MNLKSKQKGMSPITVLLLCVIFAGAIIVVLTLGPHYLDYNTIRTVFNDAARAPGAQSMSHNKLKSEISKRLSINNVRSFDFNESAYIDKADGIVTFGFEYEVRDNIAFNIDTVLTFSYEVEAKSQ